MQALETRKAAEAAKKSAIIAERDQRPWVLVSALEFNGFNWPLVNNSAEFSLTNAGKVPAISVEIEATTRVRGGQHHGRPTSLWLDEGVPGIETVSLIIGPTLDHHTRLIGIEFTENELQEVKNSFNRLIIEGTITYKVFSPESPTKPSSVLSPTGCLAPVP